MLIYIFCVGLIGILINVVEVKEIYDRLFICGLQPLYLNKFSVQIHKIECEIDPDCIFFHVYRSSQK